MSESDQPSAAAYDAGGYFGGLNGELLRAVPSGALRILEVGCAAGRLGEALKRIGPPGREVFGIELNEAAAAQAALRLDHVYSLDVARSDPPLELGSLDCMLFGDVLEHLPDPLAVLRRYKPFLKPGGIVLCSIPNLQHHTVVSALLANDFQYQPAGLLDTTHLRFFTASSILKMLLDADLLPQIIGVTSHPCPPDLASACEPLARYLALDPERLQFLLSVYQYIVSGQAMTPAPADERPMTIVACVNDEAQFANNLGASPCLRSGTHQLLLARDAKSAAEGINAGITAAVHPLVGVVHQDVYLPEGWPARVQNALAAAEKQLGPLGVAGVVGMTRHGSRDFIAGRVLDRLNLIAPETALPQPALSLDELALILPKNSPVRFDPALGWHNYGTDAVMQANAHGLVAAILDAPVLHNSRGANILYQDFLDSMRVLANKWRHRWPLETTVMRVETDGRFLFKWAVKPGAVAPARARSSKER
jgi:2-polyprenyl-3-methyl-5-hydroxy-6-metoxy-1,4-benzoquinol methylase